jgi:hypothetical protein
MVTGQRAKYSIKKHNPPTRTGHQRKTAPMKRKNELQAAVDTAWRLVETAGLHKRAFDEASLECIQDALWLIANGFPIKTIIATMNRHPKAGQRQLASLRKQREKNAESAAERKLNAAHLASVLSRIDLGALLGELGAVAISDDTDRAKRVFLAALRIWLVADRRGPELMRSTLRELKPDERVALFVRSGELQQMIQGSIQ